MTQTARVLFVDDDKSLCTWVESALGRRGFEICTRSSADEALELVSHDEFDVVVSDLKLPRINGVALCERIVANRPDLPVIVVTAFGSMDAAIAAIRAGAYDFIAKPFEIEALSLAIERAVQTRRLRDEVKRLRSLAQVSSEESGLLGESHAMLELRSMLTKVADTDSSVLITGESGTGKEIAARALHNSSRRKSGPFIAVNCAAMPEALLEAELFGHDKGAFTDAKIARTGLFKQADGGTLFLDEIGDMPIGLQPKLLRALEQRTVRPLGSSHELPFDTRLIAATHRDLASAASEGRFREDLFYRINVIELSLPPLRARGSDVLLLGQHFVREFAERSGKAVTGLSPQAAERLLAYVWPGNVRELRNCIERAVALTQFEQITVDDLPERIRAYRSSFVVVASDNPTELVPLEEVERRYILRVLESVQGNKTLAARILGLDRVTLYRKLERYRERESGAGRS
ncbi:MAG TPA: sigma-54 dependent transcriptional regulator [Polyangiales bacterium]|nr:sigma-54 dependent transcriptional regulator [Polyangiales bacterium]